MRKCFLLIVVCIIFCCCSKGVNEPPPVSESCKDFTLTDSTNEEGGLVYQQQYLYNEDGELYKHITYRGRISDSLIAWSDSFAYANGNMVKSWMSLGGENSSNPYTTSEYDYSGEKIIASRYYSGNLLLVNTEYEWNTAGRLDAFTQYADNSVYQFTPTTTYLLQYDDNSNVQQVTANGKLQYKFLNYDNKPNFFYKMPYDYAYNLLTYFPRSFSPDNFETSYAYTDYDYNGEHIHDSTGAIYSSYLYNDKNKLIRYNYSQSNGRVSNGFSTPHTVTITYTCE